MSNSISQDLLEYAKSTATDVRAIRTLLEGHLTGTCEPKTEMHENLEQFVLDIPNYPVSSLVPEQFAEQAERTQEDSKEQVVIATEQAGQDGELSARERLLANFRKRIGS